MGTISIDYGYMESAESAARKAASGCEVYINEIERKVTKKIDALQYGTTSNTSSSNYFAKQKIKQLRAKCDRYIDFADKVKASKDYAKEKDREISSYIKNESNEFRKSHDMEVNKVVEWFPWLTTTIINETSFGRWVSQLFKDAKAWIGDRVRDFKRWYELDGGKYIIKTILAVVGTVIAVALLILVAFPAVAAAVGALLSGAAITGGMIFTAVTSIAGVVTSIMSIADNFVKIGGNVAAFLNNKDDPGWAKRYSEYGSVSDFLRKNMFPEGWMNEWSYSFANGYDFVQISASLLNFADMARSGLNFAKTIKDKGVYHIFDKVNFRYKSGKMSWNSFKYGMKHAINNWKALKGGISNTNISKLQSYYKSTNVPEALKRLEKIYTIGTASVTTYEAFSKDGLGAVVVDKVVDKIKSELDLGDICGKIKSTYSDAIDLNKNMNVVTP